MNLLFLTPHFLPPRCRGCLVAGYVLGFAGVWLAIVYGSALIHRLI